MPANFVMSSRGTNILRDDNNYTYRVHQASATGDKVWYRCQYRLSHKCNATAVYMPAEGLVKRSVTEHSHEPLILRETARYGNCDKLPVLYRFGIY